MQLNRLLIAGNITRDPELRHTPKGSAVCGFSIAVNRNWTTEAGEKKEEVSFFNVEAFGRSAENIAKFFKKGQCIFIEGRIKQDTWDDKTSGQKKSSVKVVVDSWQFVGGKGEWAAPRSSVPAETPAVAAMDDSPPPF